MRGVLEALAEDLRSRGRFDLEEAFIDGSFAPEKKGAPAWVKPSEEREPKSWPLQSTQGWSSDHGLHRKRHAT
jgi:hypothetical protein